MLKEEKQQEMEIEVERKIIKKNLKGGQKNEGNT
jgi:hypothetical protein